MISEDYDIGNYKISAVVRSDLTNSETVNVVGHMALAAGLHAAHLGHGVGGVAPIIGQEFVHDGRGGPHRSCARYPLIVLQVKASKLGSLVEQAHTAAGRGSIVVVDFPRAMYETAHDRDLKAALAATPDGQLDHLGVILLGAVEDVQRLCGKLSLWRSKADDPHPL